MVILAMVAVGLFFWAFPLEYPFKNHPRKLQKEFDMSQYISHHGITPRTVEMLDLSEPQWRRLQVIGPKVYVMVGVLCVAVNLILNATLSQTNWTELFNTMAILIWIAASVFIYWVVKKEPNAS